MAEVESAWPVHWLIDEGIITWTEGHTLMNIVDVDMQLHVHLATKGAQRRAEERARRKH